MQKKQVVVDALSDITGGLSNPRKMPEYAYSTPAIKCKESKGVCMPCGLCHEGQLPVAQRHESPHEKVR